MTTTMLATGLRRRIETTELRAGIIGLGYVGVPLAVEFARAGYEVVGIDVDARKVDAIAAGKSYVPDVADTDVSRLVTSGRGQSAGLAAKLPAVVRLGGSRVHHPVSVAA